MKLMSSRNNAPVRMVNEPQMPLLPKEVELAPEDFFSLAGERPYVVAHVRSRQEKMLTRHLLGHSVPFYLPVTERRLVISGRTRRAFHPVFSGYVFLRPLPSERSVILRSGAVVSILPVLDQQQLGEELFQIRKLQIAGATFRPCVEVEAGDAVRVTHGAFSGYRGIVERIGGRDRLVVRISLIQQAVAVEFDRELLRPGR